MSKPTVIIGTYSTRGSEGIYVCDLDTGTGELTVRQTVAASNPSFLALSPSKRYLYAAMEGGDSNHAVGAYAIDEMGLQRLINTQNAGGSFPCHVAVSPSGAHIVVSCYGDGSHAVLPIRADGGLDALTCRVVNEGGMGPNGHRQEGPHAHSATFSPDGGFVYVCDLGIDMVVTYAFDALRGELNAHSSVEVEPGGGPRHFALHPTLPVAACINELDNTVVVFMRDASSGVLTEMQVISTLPMDAQDAVHHGTLGNSTADIHYSADGRFLYGSNRGHDSIACFSVDTETGAITAIGHVSTGGKTPRNFALVPGTDLLLAANQETDSVVSFHIGTDGIPVATGAVIQIPAPVCVLPL